MIRNSLLTSLGYQYHSLFKTMHCVECEQAVYPEKILLHPGSHNISIQDLDQVQIELKAFPLNHPKDLKDILPKSGGPPVEGLKVINGFKCTLCEHSAPTSRAVDNQFLKDHPDTQIPVDHRHRATQLQSFFPRRFNNFFEVNPALLKVSPNTPFSTRRFNALRRRETSDV